MKRSSERSTRTLASSTPTLTNATASPAIPSAPNSATLKIRSTPLPEGLPCGMRLANSTSKPRAISTTSLTRSTHLHNSLASVLFSPSSLTISPMNSTCSNSARAPATGRLASRRTARTSSTTTIHRTTSAARPPAARSSASSPKASPVQTIFLLRRHARARARLTCAWPPHVILRRANITCSRRMKAHQPARSRSISPAGELRRVLAQSWKKSAAIATAR